MSEIDILFIAGQTQASRDAPALAESMGALPEHCHRAIAHMSEQVDIQIREYVVVVKCCASIAKGCWALGCGPRIFPRHSTPGLTRLEIQRFQGCIQAGNEYGSAVFHGVFVKVIKPTHPVDFVCSV